MTGPRFGREKEDRGLYYKIGDVAALFGLTNETLRNYERSGLISPLREESYFR